jgi:rhomboid protease GluP
VSGNGSPNGAGSHEPRERDPSGGPGGKLQGRYAVSVAIGAACALLFVLRYVWPDGGDTEHLFRMGANHGTYVKAGEWYRLLASAFLHGDPVHLFMNLLALFSFGPVLEALFGARRYLVLYGVSALAGALASAFLKEPRLAVGASGAVWGLMTAGIAIVYRPQGLLPESVLAGARQRAWAPLAINLMYSFKPGIDFLAHLGGGAAGAALVLSGALTRGLPPLDVSPHSRRARRGSGPLWTVLAAVVGLAMAGSVAMAFVQGKPWEAGKPPLLERVAVGEGVTLLLPDVVASRVKSEAREGATSHLYGEASHAPLLFQVVVGKLDETVTPDQLEAELEGVRKTFDEEELSGSTRVSSARIETIGPHRVVIDEIKNPNGVPMKRYAVLLGARYVVVRSYGVGDRPKSWAGIEEKIVASVSTQ